MPATTVNVTANVFDQGGAAVAGALITVTLDRPDPTATGYIVPKTQTFTADANGIAVMPLWPNQLGTISSSYRVKAKHPTTGKTLFDVAATIPNANCQLSTVANQPVYPVKNSDQLALDAAIAAVAPAQAAQIAAETAQAGAQAAEINAASSAAASATSATNTAVSELNAATSAVNAATSAAKAATSDASAAASATNAAASESSVAANAAAAGASEANALALETAASAAASASAASELNTAASELNAASSEAGASTSAAQAESDALLTAADRVAVAADKTATANDRAAADAAKIGAQTAEANAVAVVAGGNGSITPTPGNYPLADAKGHIDGGWLDTFPAVSQALPSSLNIVDATISLGKNDSDGRAWAKRCQHTSWYNEARSTGAYINTLPDGYASAALAVSAGAVVGDYYYNTATARFEEVTNAGAGTESSTVTYRAGSAEFPQDVAITAEAARVIIWDITSTQPTPWKIMPRWSFTFGGGGQNDLSAVVMLDGKVVVSSNNKYGMLCIMDFVDDTVSTSRTAWSNAAQTYAGKRRGMSPTYVMGVADNGGSEGTFPLINDIVNDVAITVLPDAPIDSATGLPVPTILAGCGNAATAVGGVTQIGWDGNARDAVWHITYSINSSIGQVGFVGDKIYFQQNNASQIYIDIIMIVPLLTANRIAFTASSYTYTTAADELKIGGMQAGELSVSVHHAGSYLVKSKIIGGRAVAVGTNNGVSIAVLNPGTNTSSLIANIASTWNGGYWLGDNRRCYLANSLTADRSVKAGTLTMVGTITETVNAGGRNVYSGFSAANYLQEASHADWNALGTGDFSIIMSGVKWGTAGVDRAPVSIGDGVSAGSLLFQVFTDNRLYFSIHNGTSFAVLVSSTSTFTDVAEHVVEIKRGTFGGVASTLQILVDGAVVASAVSTLTISNTTGFLRVGGGQDIAHAFIGGQCSCVRISATAPTAEQSKFIADQENKLNGGAACLLSSSSSVSALSYDEDTDVLHVGNGTNIDQFVGLQRVSSRAIASGTLKAIAASGGQVIEAGTTGGKFDAPAVSIKAELQAVQQKVAQAQQGTVMKMIASDTSSVLTCPQGFKPIRVTSAAGTYISISTNVPVFDGFLWSITSGLAASTNYDVEMVRV